MAEIGGAALMLGTLFLLAQVATNWIAVIALVIGASLFFLLPLLKSEWERFAIGGLALQAAASFFLFEAARVSPIWIVFGLIVAWAYHRTILRSVLMQQRTLSSTQKDALLVGERGRVVAAIGRPRHGAGGRRAVDGAQPFSA